MCIFFCLLYPPPHSSVELVIGSNEVMYEPFEPMTKAEFSFIHDCLFTSCDICQKGGRSICTELHPPPFIKFHVDKVVLRPCLEFLPNVVLHFHLNQDINLPVFFSSPTLLSEQPPHTLDTTRALLFHLKRTQEFRRYRSLCVCFKGSSKDKVA